jgi:hypothetical protein
VTASSFRSRSPAANAPCASVVCSRSANVQILRVRNRQSRSAIRQRGCSATPTRTAASPADRRSTFVCRSPTSGLSRFRTV